VLGYTVEEYIGQPIMKFCPDEEELVLEIFKTLGSGNTIKDVPVRFRHKDGHIVPLLIDSNVNYTKTGAFKHTRCFIRDDTGRRVNEARQKLVIEQMRQSVKLFDAFLTKTLSIIRTPVHVAMGELELLVSSEDGDRAHALNRVVQLLGGIADMTSDVYELMQLEKGSVLTTNASAFRLDHLGVKMVDEVAPLVDPASGVELAFELEAGCGEVLVSDEGLLRRALQNLLKNAVAATKAGRIVLRVSPSGGAGAVLFAVEDTGPGIDLSDKASWFLQRYHTLTAGNVVDVEDAERGLAKLEEKLSLQSDKGGIGIGLSVAYSFVHALGGELEVTSTPGEGSRFFFRLQQQQQQPGGSNGSSTSSQTYLPLKTPAKDRRADTKKERAPLLTFQPVLEPVLVVKSECIAKQGCFQTIRTPRVLVVEDSPLCAKLLSRMLVKAGCLTECAANGALGLEKLQEHAKAPIYDMVFTDLRMPVMDGLEATRIAKRDMGLRIPIVALTAELSEETRDQCRDIGFEDCVSKPVDFKTICKLLQTFAGIEFDTESKR
jgi:signal transduction histidine kinase